MSFPECELYELTRTLGVHNYVDSFLNVLFPRFVRESGLHDQEFLRNGQERCYARQTQKLAGGVTDAATRKQDTLHPGEDFSFVHISLARSLWLLLLRGDAQGSLGVQEIRRCDSHRLVEVRPCITKKNCVRQDTQRPVVSGS